MECLLRIAISDQGGKWLPGTVLNAYPIGAKLGGGTAGCQLIIRVKTNQAKTVDEIRMKWRIMKAVNFDTVVSPLAKSTLLAQRETVLAAMRSKVIMVDYPQLSIKPDLETVIDLDKPGMLVDAPKWQIDKFYPPVPDTEIGDEILRER